MVRPVHPNEAGINGWIGMPFSMASGPDMVRGLVKLMLEQVLDALSIHFGKNGGRVKEICNLNV